MCAGGREDFPASGGMVGGFCATNVGHFQPLGMEGWRLAFHFVALISFICCLLVLKYAADPRRKVAQSFLSNTKQCKPQELKPQQKVMREVNLKRQRGIQQASHLCIHSLLCSYPPGLHALLGFWKEAC